MMSTSAASQKYYTARPSAFERNRRAIAIGLLTPWVLLTLGTKWGYMFTAPSWLQSLTLVLLLFGFLMALTKPRALKISVIGDQLRLGADHEYPINAISGVHVAARRGNEAKLRISATGFNRFDTPMVINAQDLVTELQQVNPDIQVTHSK